MIPPTLSAVCYSSWEVSSEMSYGIAEGRTCMCCAEWCRSWYRMPRMLALRRWSSCTTVVSTARTRDIFTTENLLTSRSASAQRSTDEKTFGPDRRHDRRPDWQFEGWAHVGQRTAHFGSELFASDALYAWPLTSHLRTLQETFAVFAVENMFIKYKLYVLELLRLLAFRSRRKGSIVSSLTSLVVDEDRIRPVDIYLLQYYKYFRRSVRRRCR